MSVGVLFAQQADTVQNPLASSAAAAAEGQRLFNQTCQTCHGPAAQGDRDRGGPALNTTSLTHGDAAADLFRNIRTGISGTQMPPFARLTDEQIWQLVTYIHSLQGGAPAAGVSGAMTPVEGDVAAGEAVFFGKAACSNCHEVNGRGGIVGPDLSNAARLGPGTIRQKIVAPSEPLPPVAGARGGGGGRGAPPPVTIVAKTMDGREIRGVRRNEDTFSLQMVDGTGQLHLFDKLKLASVTVENKSLMPDDYAKRLTPADITNVVAYLQMQRERDLSKTILQPMAGGVTYERLRNAPGRAAELADVLGRLSGHALLAAEADHRHQRIEAAGRVGDARFSAAIRSSRRRRSSSTASCTSTGSGNPLDRDGTRCEDRAADLALHAPAAGEEPVRDQPVQPRRGDPRAIACSSARSTPCWSRSTREAARCCGRCRWPTRWRATASRARRSW